MMLIFNQSIASGFNHPDRVWRCGGPDLRVEEVKILNSDTGAGGRDVLEGQRFVLSEVLTDDPSATTSRRNWSTMPSGTPGKKQLFLLPKTV